MLKESFVILYFPYALSVWKKFQLNPSVVLAQAAIESGWGESSLATKAHNFFGLSAYGASNEYWHGGKVETCPGGLSFRRYDTVENSFLDFGRLITTIYKNAAHVSFLPKSYAQEIAYSRYISEKNGDNRELYKDLLIRIEHSLQPVIKNKLALVNRYKSINVLSKK